MDSAVGEQKFGRESRQAPRYSIVAPLRFRGDWGAWTAATTVNIGRLGVLVRTEQAAALASRLEMHIDLTQNHTLAGSVVVCWGRVVRAEPSSDGEMFMAVTIEDFQLRPAVDGNEQASREHETRSTS